MITLIVRMNPSPDGAVKYHCPRCGELSLSHRTDMVEFRNRWNQLQYEPRRHFSCEACCFSSPYKIVSGIINAGDDTCFEATVELTRGVIAPSLEDLARSIYLIDFPED